MTFAIYDKSEFPAADPFSERLQGGFALDLNADWRATSASRKRRVLSRYVTRLHEGAGALV